VTEQWCGECGLRLQDSTPHSTWTGHTHTPVAREVMEGAAVALGLVQFSHEDGDEDSAAVFLTALRNAGITETAARMFARLRDGEEDG
jgi:hypothetical protein